MISLNWQTFDTDFDHGNLTAVYQNSSKMISPSTYLLSGVCLQNDGLNVSKALGGRYEKELWETLLLVRKVSLNEKPQPWPYRWHYVEERISISI